MNGALYQNTEEILKSGKTITFNDTLFCAGKSALMEQYEAVVLYATYKLYSIKNTAHDDCAPEIDKKVRYSEKDIPLVPNDLGCAQVVSKTKPCTRQRPLQEDQQCWQLFPYSEAFEFDAVDTMRWHT